MPPKNAPFRTTSNAIFWFFSEAWASKTIKQNFSNTYLPLSLQMVAPSLGLKTNLDFSKSIIKIPWKFKFQLQLLINCAGARKHFNSSRYRLNYHCMHKKIKNENIISICVTWGIITDGTIQCVKNGSWEEKGWKLTVEFPVLFQVPSDEFFRGGIRPKPIDFVAVTSFLKRHSR